METYPQPGTNAARVLQFVNENPGVPTNTIITRLGMNPSVVRKCLSNLAERSKVIDLADGSGNHSWNPKGRML